MLQRLAQHVLDQQLRCCWSAGAKGSGSNDSVRLGGVWGDRVIEPGGVLQQLLDGDGAVAGIDRRTGRRSEVVENRSERLCRERELALFDELVDPGGGDRLGVRRDPVE